MEMIIKAVTTREFWYAIASIIALATYAGSKKHYNRIKYEDRQKQFDILRSDYRTDLKDIDKSNRDGNIRIEQHILKLYEKINRGALTGGKNMSELKRLDTQLNNLEQYQIKCHEDTNHRIDAIDTKLDNLKLSTG